MKIIVSAGGTGGHIYPALAIIDKFKEKEKNLEVIYIGTHNRMEKDIVPQKGIDYVPLEIYGLSKTDMLRNIKNIFLIKKAEKKCLEIMKAFKPDIVLGIGGYVTYPVIKAAKKLGIKTFLHEQNSLPGKTNIALSKGVDLVGVSFDETMLRFKKAKKVIYTGHPNGEYAVKLPPAKRSEFGFDDTKKLVVFSWGSLGSSSLNQITYDYLQDAGKRAYNIIYITGKEYFAEMVKNRTFPSNVKVIPYYDPLASLMQVGDLIVSRAGAGIIAEILALKVPAILVPSPYVANNHQYYNAIEIKNKNACDMIEEKELTKELLETKIETLLYNDNQRTVMLDVAKNIKAEKACEVIYNAIKEVLK